MRGDHQHLFDSAFADQIFVTVANIFHRNRYPTAYKIKRQFIQFDKTLFGR